MSALFIIVLLLFFLALVHALVLGAWRERLLGALRSGGPQAPEDDHTMISLVVPVRNAADTVVPLLQDLHAQRHPREAMEVIVVDDHSTDGTIDVVKAMQRNWPALRSVQLDAAGQGKKQAITRGVVEARGVWVLLTDADGRCGPMRVPRVMAHVCTSGDDLLVLPVYTHLADGLSAMVQHCEQLALQGATLGAALGGAPVLANGANIAFKREAFFAVGGFTGDRWPGGDDLFLLQRMQRAGRRVGCLAHPGCAVVVEPEPSWGGFLSQRLRWAGKMRAYRGAAGQLAALAAVLLPWMVLFAAAMAWRAVAVGDRFLFTWAMLATAGVLWIVPVLRLAIATRLFFAAAPGMEAAPRALLTALRCLFAMALFLFYAPVIAILSIFVRPTWKGRRI